MRGQGHTWEADGAASEGRPDAATDDTRERILDAAVQVLREVGYGHFSVQKVARRAGVYQGNITYYWPRRRDLVLALALRVIDDYRSACLAALGTGRSSAADAAEAVIRTMVEQAVSPEMVRILPELWSMANTDPEIARAVIRSHDEVLDAMLVALGIPADGAVGSEIERILVLIGAAIQGLTAVHGHRSPDDRILALVKDSIVAHHTVLLASVLDPRGD